jgi:hypothetical protein
MSSKLTRRVLTVAAAAAAVLAVGVSAGFAGQKDDGPQKGTDHYTIGLFGDMPYNAYGKADYPYLLQDINASHVSFSIYDGDLKAGGDGPCSDSLYTTALAGFNSLDRPLIWVRATTTGPTAGAATGPTRSPTPTRSSG